MDSDLFDIQAPIACFFFNYFVLSSSSVAVSSHRSCSRQSAGRKYRLTGLDQLIDPYDVTLNDLSRSEGREWAQRVLPQLRRRFRSSLASAGCRLPSAWWQGKRVKVA